MTDRFDRQTRFVSLGPEGQARLQGSRVLLVGCGALGGSIAQTLVRAGVGELTLVDRDIVELSNLPRQVLFEEAHARAGTPKSEAALETLLRIGGPTRIVAHAAHLDASNLEELAEGAALVLDGTDNLATRYLLNDYAVREGIPWVYGGVVGAAGLVLAVLPGESACLRCVFPEAPPPGVLPTCESAGVILPAVAAVAALQTGLAMRLLARDADDDSLEPKLVEVDVWNGSSRTLGAPRNPDCPCCGARDFPHLERAPARAPSTLCGRNTVQVFPDGAAAAIDDVAERLEGLATDVVRAARLLRFEVEGLRLTLFGDGRALVEGTEDEGRARAVYDRYVGA